MLDEKLLDRLNFDELRQALDVVLEKIDAIERDTPEGEDDPRLDMLYCTGDRIIKRMAPYMREVARLHPDAYGHVDKMMHDYDEHFAKFEDTLLEEEVLLDLESPESS